MILADIEELLMHPVVDRGIPNKERIALLAQTDVQMGNFGLIIGNAAPNNMATPIRDNFLWFGDRVIHRGDWVLVFTGQGESKVVNGSEPGTKVYSIHWGRGVTMFANTNIVPLLIRLDGVIVGRAPSDLPQLCLENKGAS